MTPQIFSILKAAGWHRAGVTKKNDRIEAWAASANLVLRKGPSSVVVTKGDDSITFRLCRRKQCEDFFVPVTDIGMITDLANR